MAAIIGNILLALATVIFSLLFSAVYGKEPRGNDGGYAMGLVLFYLAFLVCMALAAIAIAWKGGFDWISPHKSTRGMMVVFGLLAAVITAAMSALFKYEPGPVPTIVRIFSGFAPAWIPLILIAAGFILLNSGIRESIPMAVYKWPLVGVFAIGMTGVCAGIYTWMAAASENAARMMESRAADADRQNADFIREIDSCDVAINMIQILVFTDSYHDKALQERALAKIKTNPKWQEVLVYWLENKGAVECFTFLASNEVDDKGMFLKPVNTAVLSIADWIRQQIREARYSSDLYPDRFSYEVERLLRTVAKFEGMGQDYLPAVREVRAALDEPTSFEKIKFDCTTPLDAWLKKRN